MKSLPYIILGILILMIVYVLITYKVTIIAKNNNRDVIIASKGGLRESCTECVRKHIAKAQILFTESQLGYPEHIYLAFGNLSEAEDESIKEYPELAKKIREVRTGIYRGESLNAEKDIMSLFKEVDKAEANANTSTNTSTTTNT